MRPSRIAPLAGSWAFPISTIAGTVVVTALAWHYTQQSYRFLGVKPFQPGTFTSLPTVRWRSGGELIAAGFSYSLMKLDSFVVLGLFGAAAAPQRTRAVPAAGKRVLVAAWIRDDRGRRER